MKEIEIPLVEKGCRERVERSYFYLSLQAIAKPLFGLYFRHESHGLDNIPNQAGAIIATNHASNIDPPLIAVDVKRPLYMMAKQSLHEIPLIGSFIRRAYSFPVRRGVIDTSALRTAISLLDNDNLVLMFPEGTRSPDGRIQEARPGVGKIVAESDVPVVPGYVKGSFEAFPKGGRIPKPRKTSVHFGESIEFHPRQEQSTTSREDYESISNDILQAIRTIKKRVESTS